MQVRILGDSTRFSVSGYGNGPTEEDFDLWNHIDSNLHTLLKQAIEAIPPQPQEIEVYERAVPMEGLVLVDVRIHTVSSFYFMFTSTSGTGFHLFPLVEFRNGRVFDAGWTC